MIGIQDQHLFFQNSTFNNYENSKNIKMKSSCLYQANFQHQNQECPREFGKTFGNTSFLTENSNKENAPNFFNVQRHYMKENRVFNAFPYNNKENLGMI